MTPSTKTSCSTKVCFNLIVQSVKRCSKQTKTAVTAIWNEWTTKTDS